MKFPRFISQDVLDAAAWLMAAFLLLALVNFSRGALRGAAPPPLPPNPQIVRQPQSGHGDAAARSAQVTRPRRRE